MHSTSADYNRLVIYVITSVIFLAELIILAKKRVQSGTGYNNLFLVFIIVVNKYKSWVFTISYAGLYVKIIKI